MQEKKIYVSPSIESEIIDLPEAFACTIYGLSDDHGTWSGTGILDQATLFC